MYKFIEKFSIFKKQKMCSIFPSSLHSVLCDVSVLAFLKAIVLYQNLPLKKWVDFSALLGQKAASVRRSRRQMLLRK